MINEQQWLEIVSGIIQFNRLVTTPAERESEEYILKCLKLTDDEIEEYVDSVLNSEEELKEVCDIVVTAVQALDAITPSFLKWEHIQSRVNAVLADHNTRLVTNGISNLIAMAIVTAEKTGYDLHGAMLEVNMSNMSKVVHIPTLEESFGEHWTLGVYKLVNDLTKEYEGRYTGINYTKVGDYLLFRDDKLKVLKPKGFYKEPDLKQFMTRGE
jgi:Ni,Fe-hydrogenase I large subunit